MPKAASKPKSKAEFRFESVNIDSLCGVLDAVAFITTPTTKSISQFADIDPRTAGKLLKNAQLIGLVDSAGGDAYLLVQPYPFKGTADQKQRVGREALLRSPILEKIRQFMGLCDNLPNAMRKAMTVAGELNCYPDCTVYGLSRRCLVTDAESVCVGGRHESEELQHGKH